MIHYYENINTKEKIRWDPAQVRNNTELLPGRAGINHWHRINIKKKGEYLDSDGNTCLLSDNKSLLIPKEQTDIDYNDIAYNVQILDDANSKLIKLLDDVTDNWLHDSILQNISIKMTYIVIEFSYYKNINSNLVIKFIRKEGTIKQKDIMDFKGKEVYRIKLYKRNLGNEIEITTSNNDTLIVFYDEIQYVKKGV